MRDTTDSSFCNAVHASLLEGGSGETLATASSAEVSSHVWPAVAMHDVSRGGVKSCLILAGATHGVSSGGIMSRWCDSGWRRGGYEFAGLAWLLVMYGYMHQPM